MAALPRMNTPEKPASQLLRLDYTLRASHRRSCNRDGNAPNSLNKSGLRPKKVTISL
jgi:hypothetical protein